jgi:Family of unknown function (DUF6252)
MKTIVFPLVKTALFSILIALVACSGEENPSGNEEISASVSGVGSFTSSKDFDTVFGTKVVTEIATSLNIQGTDNSGKGFLLRISPYDGPGTYELGVADNENLAIWINGPTPGDQYSTAFQGSSGSIVVSADAEGIVEGTFGFTGKLNDTSAAKTITNGKFKVNFQ